MLYDPRMTMEKRQGGERLELAADRDIDCLDLVLDHYIRSIKSVFQSINPYLQPIDLRINTKKWHT